MRIHWWAALTGVVAAAVMLAVAEGVALVLAPGSSPFLATGQFMIDLAPSAVKDLMIALFGTGDKAALFVMLAAVVLVLAGITGVLERRRTFAGVALLVLFSAVAVFAVTTRADASGLWALPTVVGATAGVLVLRASAQRLDLWARATGPDALTSPGGFVVASESAERGGSAVMGTPGTPAGDVPRRRFLRYIGAASALAVVAGLGARAVNAGAAAVTAARQAVTLPRPKAPAPALPAGSEIDVPGLSSLVTPNAEFYRIDLALQVPQIDPRSWTLKITGLVEDEVTLDYEKILALPLTEHVATIACVSNEVGDGLIGTATWLGYPLRELLALARPASGADMVLSSGPDGFSAGTPLSALTDPGREALLAVGMNGEPLPVEHGFPARMIVPGLFGYVSATKWVTELKVTRFADEEGYWTPRGWSALGPVVTQSRIDVPLDGQTVASGTVAVAGVAWAPHTGIERVEVRVDDGPWREAALASAISIDTWVQWWMPWQAPEGRHTITVRSTDRSGYTQTSTEAPPAPSGATGWHIIEVTIVA